MIPFSNGTEFMYWQADNCDTCVRAFRPAKGKELPDFGATQRLVNLGRECRIKFAIELGVGCGTGEMPDDVAALAGWKGEGGLPWDCMMHSDDDNDRWKPGPRKPPPEDDRQIMLFSIVDDVLLEQDKIVKEYA